MAYGNFKLCRHTSAAETQLRLCEKKILHSFKKQCSRYRHDTKFSSVSQWVSHKLWLFFYLVTLKVHKETSQSKSFHPLTAPKVAFIVLPKLTSENSTSVKLSDLRFYLLHFFKSYLDFHCYDSCIFVSPVWHEHSRIMSFNFAYLGTDSPTSI